MQVQSNASTNRTSSSTLFIECHSHQWIFESNPEPHHRTRLSRIGERQNGVIHTEGFPHYIMPDGCGVICLALFVYKCNELMMLMSFIECLFIIKLCTYRSWNKYALSILR